MMCSQWLEAIGGILFVFVLFALVFGVLPISIVYFMNRVFGRR